MSKSLKKKVTAAFKDPSYRPLNKSEFAREFGLPPKDRADLRRILQDLEDSGAIIRGKKGRYTLPAGDSDVLVGEIRLQRKGHAFFMPDPDNPSNKATGRDLDSFSRIFIPARHTGTALNRDRVAVRLQEAGNGGRSGSRGKSKGPKNRRPGEDALGVEGRVTRVVERKTNSIVATLHQKKKFRYCVPQDALHPPTIELNDSPLDAGATPGDIVVVSLDEWKSPTAVPRGHIEKVLGPPDTPGIDILSIIHKHNLPLEFPDAILRQAESVPGEVLPEETANREDWRKREVFTIDPFDARDFDDAIAVTALPEGGWELAVHIADVSHYVTPGSAIDKEARQRGNSVYLVDRVIPMLPENLSNGICSLRPHVDRLTRAVIMTFDAKGNPLSARFAASVIHSAARLTYEEAFDILKPHLAGKSEDQKSTLNNQQSTLGNQDSEIENRKSKLHRPQSGSQESEAKRRDTAEPAEGGIIQVPETLPSHLHTAWDLADTLRKRRFKRGGLDLDMPEVKVLVDKNGKPTDMVRVEYDESHQLIEEFMLAANEAVAKAIKDCDLPSVYRIHEDPDADRLFEFRELARIHNYQIGDLTQRGEIQKLLKMVRGQPEERLIKIGLLKSLKRAVYHADPLGHYGLAKIDYTHFTSPIRRYADLIVHRVLGNLMFDRAAEHERHIQSKTSVPSYPGLTEIAKHISGTERSAAEAEQDSVKLKQLEYFHGLVRENSDRTFSALILEVAHMGMFVELEDYFIRGLVRRDDFPENADWFFDLQSQRIFGKRPKIDYQTGDELDVRVANVDFEKGFLDFRIAD